MICKCMHCEKEYENDREYKTSICDECFKRFNEGQLQPLKDQVHMLAFENNQLKTKLRVIERRREEDEKR